MRALICRQWGGIEQLQIGEAPVPRPGRGEVLIRVKATAVNYADAIIVAGRYQTKPGLPFSPGLEIAGRANTRIHMRAGRLEGWDPVLVLPTLREGAFTCAQRPSGAPQGEVESEETER